MTKIRKKNELQLPTNVVGAIYGQTGIGKTTVALSASKPLLLDTDNGIHRVQYDYRCDTVQVTSYQDVLDVLEEDLSDYDTIVIDTLGELVQYMLVYLADNDKTLITRGGTYNIKIWGLVKEQFKQLKFKLQQLHKNLIFVAHQKADGDGEQQHFTIDCAGSTGDEIKKILDFFGYMEMVGKTRSISFAPSARFYAKNSIQLEDYIEVPTLANGAANNFLEEVIIKPTIEERKKEMSSANDIAELEALIACVNNPNHALSEFKNHNLKPAQKRVLFNKLKKQFADWTFDKTTGEFING